MNTVSSSAPVCMYCGALRSRPPSRGCRVSYAGGLLDEVVTEMAHLEKMDRDYWMLTLDRADGSTVVVHLRPSTRITATVEERTAEIRRR